MVSSFANENTLSLLASDVEIISVAKHFTAHHQ